MDIDMGSLERKMQSLQSMAKMVGPEGEAAKRIIQSLIQKYKLNPEEYSLERKWITYKTHRLKRYAFELALFCKITAVPVPGKPDYISINADSLEYKMFHELLGEIKHHFNKKERELLDLFFGDPSPTDLAIKNDKLKSFMAGYMKGNFPYDNRLCTLCGRGRIGDPDPIGMLGKCSACGAKFKFGRSSFRTKGTDAGEFEVGRSTTTKSLRANRNQLTHN